jgi:hypothetical protein
VAGDEVYGADPNLRGEIESRGVGYVLAIGMNRRVNTGAGPVRADAATRTLPKRTWQPHSAGDGAKGPRLYLDSRGRRNTAVSWWWTRA